MSSLDHVGGVLDGFSRSKGAALAAVAVLATAEGELLAAPDGARAWGRVDGYSASTTWNAPDGNAFATKATPLEGVMGVDGWRVVAMQSEATLDAPVAAMGFRLLAAFGLGLLLTALGMVLVSQRIVDPIRRLMAATQKGDRVSDIPTIAVSSRDEVGVLTESFNRMIEAVRDYEVGLERKVEERTEALTRAQREMQDILDNVSQGMFTVGRDGSVNGGYSAFTVEVLGTEDVRGRQALDLLQVSESRDVMTTSRMKFWLENVFGADELQWMLAEDEPVKSWELDGQDGTAKTLALEYAPIYEDDEVDKIMVVAKDVTAIKALEAEVAQQASSLSRMSEIATLDPELLDTFLTETKEILALSGEAVERIEVDPGDKSAIHALFRQVHTIKGNARVFDIRSVQDHAHRVESDLAPLREGTEPLTPEQVADVKSRIVSIGALVQEIEALARPILDRRSPAAHKRLDEATVEKVTKTFAALRRDLDDGVSLDDSLRELGAAVRGLSMQRLDETFERLEKMVVDLARELDKPLAGLHLDCGDLRVERSAADALRDALLHILRNAVDHGIESADERRAAGKPEQAKLELVARMVDDELVVEVRDDGRGIDKERVRAAAKRRDVADTGALESMVTQDLLQLVFEAGFSTRDEVSDVSGRGVGMDVVAQAVRELSGRTELSSSLGAGTQLSI
ncbi:MAG: ATP-binding protein, partial [Deltaproteobacteria bacterium]